MNDPSSTMRKCQIFRQVCMASVIACSRNDKECKGFHDYWPLENFSTPAIRQPPGAENVSSQAIKASASSRDVPHTISSA